MLANPFGRYFNALLNTPCCSKTTVKKKIIFINRDFPANKFMPTQIADTDNLQTG